MNELGILLHILSQRTPITKTNWINSEFGATEEEICKTLKFEGKNQRTQFLNILKEFTNFIMPLNLEVRQNMFNQKWFLTQQNTIQEFFKTNPFLNKKRLAATMIIIISLCITQNGETTISEIKKIRKKKDITDDLKDLEELNLITQDDQNNISLHPNIGYYVNIDQFLEILEKSIV